MSRHKSNSPLAEAVGSLMGLYVTYKIAKPILGALWDNSNNQKTNTHPQARTVTPKAASSQVARRAESPKQLTDRGYGYEKEKNYSAAFNCYQKAASQGYARAQGSLGYLYSGGLGVRQDYKKTVYWYRKAAEQGDARAQCNLGYLYYQGYGVPKSEDKAIYWYRQAISRGSEQAKKNLNVLLQEQQRRRTKKASQKQYGAWRRQEDEKKRQWQEREDMIQIHMREVTGDPSW